MLNKPILNTFKLSSVVKTFPETSLMRFRNREFKRLIFEVQV